MFLDSFDWHPYFSYLGLFCFFHEGHLFLGLPKKKPGRSPQELCCSASAVRFIPRQKRSGSYMEVAS